MNNIFDYLRWRGSLTIASAPFCNADAMILALLAYIPFEGIVSDSIENRITIKEASDSFFELERDKGQISQVQDIELIRQMGAMKRFADMELFFYVNETDITVQKQFAAITVAIGNNKYYTAFRGTDNSFVGWKESLDMAFQTVPSQSRGVDYIKILKDNIDGGFYIGGHSKGGNIAMYAASFSTSDFQDKILGVFNFDGPGFNGKVLDSKGYLNIRDRLKTFVPQSSVVGMLLEHEDDYAIVHSSQVGFLQHDLYSWEVNVGDFLYLKESTKSGAFISGTLRGWITSLDDTQRGEFISALYSVFSSTKATTIDEFAADWRKNAAIVLSSVGKLDEVTKQTLISSLGLLVRAARQNFFPAIRGHSNKDENGNKKIT